MVKHEGFVGLARALDGLAWRVNRVNEAVCALLAAAMILVVWFGVADRYVFQLGTTWTEEAARYLMIWTALMAVPACAHRREHIGLDILFSRFPLAWQPWLRLTLDLIGLAFFAFLTVYGIGMARQGAGQFSTMFGMSMLLPFLSVPVSSGLTCLQIIASIFRDFAGIRPAFLDKESVGCPS